MISKENLKELLSDLMDTADGEILEGLQDLYSRVDNGERLSGRLYNEILDASTGCDEYIEMLEEIESKYEIQDEGTLEIKDRLIKYGVIFPQSRYYLEKKYNEM